MHSKLSIENYYSKGARMSLIMLVYAPALVYASRYDLRMWCISSLMTLAQTHAPVLCTIYLYLNIWKSYDKSSLKYKHSVSLLGYLQWHSQGPLQCREVPLPNWCMTPHKQNKYNFLNAQMLVEVKQCLQMYVCELYDHPYFILFYENSQKWLL